MLKKYFFFFACAFLFSACSKPSPAPGTSDDQPSQTSVEAQVNATKQEQANATDTKEQK